MRQQIFPILQVALRRLRPDSHRASRPLGPGSTVLYLQFETPLGCCVHGTPLVEAFRAAAPEVRVLAATRSTGAAVLAHHPGIDHLLTATTDPRISPVALLRTAAEIRRWLRQEDLHPDWIISDASNRRTGSALLAVLLRLGPTAGFADSAALYDVHLPYNAEISLIANNLRLPPVLGGAATLYEPAVFFTAANLEHAHRFFARDPPGFRGRIGIVLQGSGGQRTSWHVNRFAEVIGNLEAAGHNTVFFGTAADAAGIDRVRALAKSNGVSLAGQTTIPQAAAVLTLCDLLITVDTGTMHLGRAVGVPMVVLGPSWQRPTEWLPLGLSDVRILRGPDRKEVPSDYLLDEITVPDVLAAAHGLLASYPPLDSARQTRSTQRLSGTRPGLLL